MSARTGWEGKRGSVIITAEMRRNARANIERYDWARARLENLKRQARPYMEMDLEALWGLLPSQEMGRSAFIYSFHSRTSPHDKGCPQCYLERQGAGVGEYDSSRVDLLGRPWQVQCRRCRTWLPKNDFEAYYRSALDETGRFRAGKGDPRYLEPVEGVEGEAAQWIEDGSGIEYDGYKWFIAGRYAFAMWVNLAGTAERLALLYTLTGDSAYAGRAAVILDRMADFYPEMYELEGREAGMTTPYPPGRIMGRGWEYGRIRIPVARAYDYIYDSIREDKELVVFLDRMSKAHKGPDKSSFEAVDGHIRRNLLIEMAQDMIDIGTGLRGRGQGAQAVLAAALDDPELTPRYIDWIFREDGGELGAVLTDHIQRDGFNVDCGTGYMVQTGERMYEVADVLGRHDYGARDIYRDYPMALNFFTMLSRVRVLGATNPAFGDGGSSMHRGERRLPLEMLVGGYMEFGSEAIAREIIHQTGGNLERLFNVNALIFSEDPEAIVESIRAQVPGEPEPHKSYNSGGTGLAVLQAPFLENGRASAVWYGRSMWTSHAHADRLTLHLWAFGEALMPDLGYPGFTGHWPKRHGFTRHTISHNTLMINDTRQDRSYSGKTVLFGDAGFIRVADIDGLGKAGGSLPGRIAGTLYPDVRTYRRAVVMVDVDEKDSYLLDIFWARGGDTHRLIQNGAASTASTSGLKTTKQKSGTFAGVDVAYGEEYDLPVGWGYAGTGFQFLERVERDESPPERFWIDWEISPRYPKPAGWKAHMRVHNLSKVDEVALADGIPSRGHPDRIRYSIRSRFGEDLSTQFISVIEPYMDKPFIESAGVIGRAERDNHPFAAAVEVLLADGRRDVILVREEPGKWGIGEFHLNGRVGAVRFDDSGKVEKIAAIAAEQAGWNMFSAAAEPGKYSGELAGYDDSDPSNVLLKLSSPVGDDAAGKYIIFDNAEIADGSYRIKSVPDEYTVSIGQMQIYERLASRRDYGAGRVPNIRPGEPYIIPRCVVICGD